MKRNYETLMAEQIKKTEKEKSRKFHSGFYDAIYYSS